LSDHLNQTQIKGYGRRPLPAAEWLFVSDHLSVCEACRRRVEDLVDDEATYLALKSGVFDETDARSSSVERAHLTFEQMAGFIDEAVAAEDLQVVKDHLAWCEECETAVDDLRAFKDQVAPELERENRPPPMGAAAEGRWRRLVAVMASFRPKSPAPVFGSALAIILLAAAGSLGWRALQGSRARLEVVVTAPTPSVSPSGLPDSTSEGASTAVIARLNDGGGQVTLDREGKLFGADHLPPAYRRMIERALTDQEIERSPLLAGLTQPGSMSRGDGGARRGAFSVIEPVGVVTFSDHPTFHWSRLDGATGYVVEVYDERFDPAATSPQVIDTSWTPPQSLKRGGIYYWQVKAVKDGREFKSPRPPAPQAKFRILDEARANELAKARRAYASSRLTLGLLYAKAGLLNEAELEFHALLKANPDSALARRLLSKSTTRGDR
jgi:predicted anti-sigma-YlaC factor YlaD